MFGYKNKIIENKIQNINVQVKRFDIYVAISDILPSHVLTPPVSGSWYIYSTRQHPPTNSMRGSCNVLPWPARNPDLFPVQQVGSVQTPNPIQCQSCSSWRSVPTALGNLAAGHTPVVWLCFSPSLCLEWSCPTGQRPGNKLIQKLQSWDISTQAFSFLPLFCLTYFGSNAENNLKINNYSTITFPPSPAWF